MLFVLKIFIPTYLKNQFTSLELTLWCSLVSFCSSSFLTFFKVVVSHLLGYNCRKRKLSGDFMRVGYINLTSGKQKDNICFGECMLYISFAVFIYLFLPQNFFFRGIHLQFVRTLKCLTWG